MSKRTLSKMITLLLGITIGICTMHYYDHYQEKQRANATAMSDPGESISSLQDKVWNNGDQDAYYKLSLFYLDDDDLKGCLFYSLYLANNFKDSKACWDVYFALWQPYSMRYKDDSALYKMDTATRNLALQYLKVGAEGNDSPCINTIKELKDNKYPEEWFK